MKKVETVQGNSDEKRISWKEAVIAGLIFLFIAIVYTYPLVADFPNQIPGYGNDVSQYYWCHWWFGEAMGDGANPWFTDHQWYPNGTPLVFSTNRFASAAAGWLLTPVFGETGAYNFIILLSFAVSALGVYIFIKLLFGNRLAAYAAGFIFAFSPYKLNVLMHHHFLLGTYTFGFSVLLLYNMLKSKEFQWGKAIWLGALFAFTIYESVFLALFLAMLLLTVFLGFASVRFKETFSRGQLLSYAVSAGSALVLCIPMAVMIFVTLPEYGGFPKEGGLDIYNNDLLHLVAPSPIPFSEFGGHTGDLFTPANHTYRTPEENFGMPGWVVLAGAAFGFWVTRKRLIASISLVGALLFAILSLGPVLYIGGKLVNVPMPYGLIQWVPFFSMVRTPNRLILIAFAFLAVLFAGALAWLLKKGERKYHWIAIALLVLLFVDYMPHGVDVIDYNDVPVAVKTLRDSTLVNDEREGVLHYGFKYFDNLRYGAYHRKPINAGYTSRTTLFSRPLQDFSVILLHNTLKHGRQHPDSPRLPAIRESVSNVFTQWGFAAVLMRTKRFEPEEVIEALGGEIIVHEDHVAHIELPPYEGEPRPLIISPDTWPEMEGVGLHTGRFSDQYWSYFAGFDLAIPDAFLKEGRITMRIGSALRMLDRFRHTLVVYVNREPIRAVDIGYRVDTITIQVPEEVKRRPVNLIAVRSLVEFEKRNTGFPFSAEIISANSQAGNTAGLYVNGKELLPHSFNNRALFFAVSPDGKEFKLAKRFDEKPNEIIQEVTAYFASGALNDQRFLIVFNSGDVPVRVANELIDGLKAMGINIFKNQIIGRSACFVIDLVEKRVANFESDNTLISGLVNKTEDFQAPLLNLKRMIIE